MATEAGQPVRKYEVRARFEQDVVRWTFAFMTDDGEKHELPLRDGEEVPLLLDMCHRDWTVYFDSASKTFRTGWNTPGNKMAH